MIQLLALAGIAGLGACPYFSEILPDPTTVEDSRGEFIEIRLTSSAPADTLLVLYEGKTLWKGTPRPQAERLLLIRDTLLCPKSERIQCERLTGTALPNGKGMQLALQNGACQDSAKTPSPKAGKSWVRSGEAYDAWERAEPSPGMPDPQFDSGVNDCALRIENVAYENGAWAGSWTLDGCDSAWISATFTAVHSLEKDTLGELLRKGKSVEFKFRSSSRAFALSVTWPEDDVPGNDLFDTLIAAPGGFPVRMTEVHPCPEEGIPEWIEIYNSGAHELSLSNFSLCENRKGKFPDVSIGQKESVLLTKDSASLRNFVRTADVKILQLGMGYLKNSADTVFLCYGSDKIDSVIWGKTARIQSKCPAGFSTLTGRKENSPGFQTPGSTVADTALPFDVEWNARIFHRKKRNRPLLIRIRSEEAALVELISGKGELLWKATFDADAAGNVWRLVPLLEKGIPGPNFLRISQGSREKRVGLVLRP